MRCPSCGFRDSAVYDSRMRRDPRDGVWRRRRCLDCDHRWTTYERNTSALVDEITLDQAVNCLSALLAAIEQGIDADDLTADMQSARRTARKILRQVPLDGRQATK